MMFYVIVVDNSRKAVTSFNIDFYHMPTLKVPLFMHFAGGGGIQASQATLSKHTGVTLAP